MLTLKINPHHRDNDDDHLYGDRDDDVDSYEERGLTVDQEVNAENYSSHLHQGTSYHHHDQFDNHQSNGDDSDDDERKEDSGAEATLQLATITPGILAQISPPQH